MLSPPTRKKWDYGDYQDIAIIKISENDLYSRFEADLLEGVETGLGDWIAFAGELPNGSQVEFIRYKDAPHPLSEQFTIRVDRKQEPLVVLDKICRVLDIPKNLLVWTKDEAAI